MDIEALWDKALKNTEILRSRVHELETFRATTLPYVFLAESGLNHGDTIVRRGQVVVERPALILPSAQFQGFEFDTGPGVSDDAVLNFLFVRGVRFPSLRYRHELSSLDVREGSLQQAIDVYADRLAKAEDVHTGLVVGPEDAWQFSVLILVGSLISRSLEDDVRRLLSQWRRKERDG